MTQKRGLGRGLGALIPGAGSTPAPAPEGELRTRVRPATEEPERSSSPRPVDMFFSGEKVTSEEERPQRERGRSQDLAGEMAKAAAARRGRGTTARGAGARSGSSAKAAADGEGGAETAAPATTAEAPTTKTPTKKTSTRKSSAGRTSTAKSSSTAGSTTTRSGSTKKAAATKPAETKPEKDSAASTPSASGTKRSSTRSAASTKASAEKPSARPAETGEDSPVVDVEEVVYTPARDSQEPSREAAQSAEQSSEEPTDSETETIAATEAPAVEESLAEGSTPEPEQPSEAPQDVEPVRQELVSVPGAEFAEIPIHEIRENPRNPRTMFDDDELDELAYSLREVGVLQPVVVRPISVTEDGESFELVMGERRWRAARLAGLTSIPAIIRETSDDDLLRDALLENLHRSQLNPLEEANAYQQLLEDFGCTQDELGERIGRSRPQITNTLRLLRLPALVQRRLASGALSAGHARALLSLDDPSLMEELAQRIVTEGLSVRAVERLVARGGEQTATRTIRRSTYDPHVVDLTSRLSNRLETQVRIDVGKRKGKITLEFTNLEDLERLVETMGLDLPLPETGTAGD